MISSDWSLRRMHIHEHEGQQYDYDSDTLDYTGTEPSRYSEPRVGHRRRDDQVANRRSVVSSVCLCFMGRCNYS